MNRVGWIFLAAGLAACQAESPKLVPPPVKKVERVQSVRETRSFVLNPKVDILFVVDNSGSMYAKQQNLAANINLFTASLKRMALDYHIGVLTSTIDEFSSEGGGRLVGSPNFVDTSTPNGDWVLSNRLIVGTSGSGVERFFDPVYLALTPPLIGGLNAGFYRQVAHLAVIFITDAEEQSNMSGPDFYNFLVGLKHNKDKVLAYAAIIPSGAAVGPSCDRDDPYQLPVKMENFLQMMRSTPLNLCDGDFGLKFADLGANLARRVGRTLYLDRPPVLDSIKVTYDGVEVPNDINRGWVYNSELNALELTAVVNFSANPTGKFTVDYVAAEYN